MQRRRPPARRARRQAPAAPPTDILWLVACHGPGGTPNAERTWCAYAHRSRPGAVIRMNARPYDHGHPDRGESAPAGRLSTLAAAVTAARRLPQADAVTLVLFMHGNSDLTRSWGFIHSTGQAPMIDTTAMDADPRWDDRALPFGWRNRNRNVHYRPFVQAINGWQSVTRIHLYGCRLADALFRSHLAQIALDTGKEIWGYTGYTVSTAQRLRIVNIHDASAPTADGARAQGNGFARVSLETNNGLLPGWQMRVRPQGGNPLIDFYTTNDLGWTVVETHTPQTIADALAAPLRSVRLP